ncbi:hypothetical protein PTKIN_Ptkin01aG0122900 [Pterospermum kingtungense]
MVFESDFVCIENTRIDRLAFHNLCDMLKTIGRLMPTKNMNVEEMVAIFLYIISHHAKNRIIKREFVKSGETVSRQFGHVLNSILRLQGVLLKKPDPVLEIQLILDGSGLRNVIEKCFGLLKMRWTILRERSWYPAKTACRIISACALLHNHIRREMTLGPLEGHKDAAGLRNKPFSHYDELGIIFGKDRAIKEGAEAAGDAVENIQVEEAIEKAASEAYDAMNNGENYDDYFDVNLENVSESILFTNTGNSESSPSIGKRPTMQGEKDMARKRQKTKKSSEIDETFVKNMAKLGEICEGAKEEIGKLASCFQHLADNAKRKMQVYDVMLRLKV